MDDQVAECRERAESEGWEVVAVVPETGSASRHARKARERWPEAAELIESGRVDMLMTWEFSRATRELEFYVALRNACAKAKVMWWYGGTVYDMSKREDRFRTGLDALMAEDETDRTSERVQRGTRRAAERGRPGSGQASFGYRRVYDSRTGDLLGQEPDPEKAPIVRELAERVLQGEPLLRLCKELNARGVTSPNGRPWDITKMKAMILRAGLAGLRVHRGKVVGRAEWDGILADSPEANEDIHYQLVELLTAPERRFMKDGAVRHLLTHLAACGVCGGKIRRHTVKGNSKYQCAERFCVARMQDYVDDVVTKAVIKRLSREDARELFVADTSKERAKARAELAELEQQLEDYYQAAEAEELSPMGLARMEKSLLPKIEEAKRRFSTAHLSPLIADLIEKGPERRWWELSITQHREVVREIMTVYVCPSKVRGHPGPETVRIEWK